MNLFTNSTFTLAIFMQYYSVHLPSGFSSPVCQTGVPWSFQFEDPLYCIWFDSYCNPLLFYSFFFKFIIQSFPYTYSDYLFDTNKKNYLNICYTQIYLQVIYIHMDTLTYFPICTYTCMCFTLRTWLHVIYVPRCDYRCLCMISRCDTGKLCICGQVHMIWQRPLHVRIHIGDSYTYTFTYTEQASCTRGASRDNVQGTAT